MAQTHSPSIFIMPMLCLTCRMPMAMVYGRLSPSSSILTTVMLT